MLELLKNIVALEAEVLVWIVTRVWKSILILVNWRRSIPIEITYQWENQDTIWLEFRFSFVRFIFTKTKQQKISDILSIFIIIGIILAHVVQSLHIPFKCCLTKLPKTNGSNQLIHPKSSFFGQKFRNLFFSKSPFNLKGKSTDFENI